MTTVDAPIRPRRVGRPALLPWYTGLLCAGTAVVAAVAPVSAVTHEPGLLVALVLATLVLDRVRVDLFERFNISPAGVPVLALAALFGPLGPIAAEIAVGLTRAVERVPFVRWAWDLGALSLSGAAAAAVFALLPAHGAGLVAVGGLAGLVYYVVNTTLLAIVVWVARGTRPLDNWREQSAWLAPHFLAFGLLAGLVVVTVRQMGPVGLLLFAVPVAILLLAEKQYLDRSRESVAELRRSHAELETANAGLRRLLEENQELLERIQNQYLSTITSLARTIEAKDPYTGGHTERVADIAGCLAQELGFSPEELRAVEVGAIIHDIGKIGVPDSILLKPGKLDEEERATMQQHPEISSYIVGDLDLPDIVKQMVRAHHERWDGGGYPDGVAGEQIPLAARILTVADALDAMTSDRPYRAALTPEAALAEIRAQRGKQFCPQVVDALERGLPVLASSWTHVRSANPGAVPIPS